MTHPLASSLNEKASNGRPLSGEKDSTDLNVILRQIFDLYEPEFQKVAAVVRCDTLPSVRCHPEELMHVFEDLLFMIMQNPPDTGRLLIYIKCEPLTDTVKTRVSTGTDQFKISIHTNISKGADWEVLYA